MDAILREKYPKSHKVMKRQDTEIGVCKGSLSLFWNGYKTGPPEQS